MATYTLYEGLELKVKSDPTNGDVQKIRQINPEFFEQQSFTMILFDAQTDNKKMRLLCEAIFEGPLPKQLEPKISINVLRGALEDFFSQVRAGFAVSDDFDYLEDTLKKLKLDNINSEFPEKYFFEKYFDTAAMVTYRGEKTKKLTIKETTLRICIANHNNYANRRINESQ